MFKKIAKRVVTFTLAVLMVMAVAPMHIFAVGSVTTYEDFMTKLKQLEIYADEYADSVHRDPAELVLNFIRTGVDRYQDSNWTTLAGQEIVGFTQYVEAQDKETGTTVMDLRNIVVSQEFTLPNGNPVDFGHMFGCMNISYVAPGSADLSGWAGDLCDLFRYCVQDAKDFPENATIDEMATYIRENYLGEKQTQAFGWDDFYGDMDAYYLITEYKKAKGSKKFSELMEDYFGKPGTTNSKLDDTVRTVYFMNNRFAVENSKEAVRKAIYDSYSSDVGIKVLESSREISAYSTLRMACCYAFADYIFSQADGGLIAGSGGTAFDNDYYSVFSSKDTVLAPGITQSIKYAQTVDGKQIVYYVATVDVTRDDVTIMANYKDNDPSKGWGYQTVMDQANALIKNNKDKYENFNVIVATNADGYNMATGEPGGLLVMNGKEWHSVDHDGFFAILKNGRAMIGTQAEYETYKDQIQEAVGGFGAVLIKDGRINVTKNANYEATRASRTAVGIKADGSVVMMVLDGRQLPFSAGGAMEEIAQIMLDAGCIHAINLDGGGSTTYLSKPAGSDTLQLTNRPSDGSARSVSNSLVAISTAKPSTELEKAIVTSDYDYITSGTSMQMNVIGVSNTGNAAVIPTGSYWRISEATQALGTIDSESGVFTAAGNVEEPVTGEVVIEFIVNGQVAGSKTLNIVIPDDITFAEDRIVAIYGEPKKIDVTVWYQGYPVAFTPLADVGIFFPGPIDEEGNQELLFVSEAGVIDGITFTGTDENSVRVVTIVAAVQAGEEVIPKYATINMYYKDEATFDFENATKGNRTLAWLREVTNAKSLDNFLYRIIDPKAPVGVNYTFALDMTTIDIPGQLEPLKGMLPGADKPNASAWNFLLQLAERVCVQTTVKITAQFSSNLDVDISELKVINEYFTMTSATLDEETNVLTVVCNWVNQTAPIDPATANPLCILTGIKATVKDDANYVDSEILISNNGHVSYDIYLAASSLYSFAQKPENQAEYGLYPYIHEEDCRGDFDKPMGDEATVTNNDKGAHFSSQYAEFADVYTINSEIRKGWKDDSYYVENQEVTGVQFIPSKENPYKKYFYRFDEKGILVEAMSGLIEYEGKLYYAQNGEPQIRWKSLTDDNGNKNDYYFHPTYYYAVDGVQIIDEGIKFTYTFENCILVKGDLRTHTYNGKTGLGYRWAGAWVHGQWFEYEGNSYYIPKSDYIVATGVKYWSSDAQDIPHTGYYLFDENGVFLNDRPYIYNGMYFEDGMAYNYSSRYVLMDGYYYFVDSLKVTTNVKGKYMQANKTFNIPEGWYDFDEYGRLTNALISENIVKNETKTEVTTTIMGRALTVTAGVACRVVYKDASGKYHLLDAMKNPYATATLSADGEGQYNFAVPAEATEVQILVAGDANGDGQVTQEDVTKAMEGFKDSSKLTGAQRCAADIDGDGKITSVDIAYILAASKKGVKFDW